MPLLEHFPPSCRVQQRSLELVVPRHPQEMPLSSPNYEESKDNQVHGEIQAPTYKLSKGIHLELSDNILF